MDARAMPEAVPEDSEPPAAQSEQTETRLRAHVETLEQRLRKRDDQRRALLHIMADLNEANRRLADQRRAMLHILADYEKDRSRLAGHTERLDKSRRALLHILQDYHQSNLRPPHSPKAKIPNHGHLRETPAGMQPPRPKL